MPLEYEPVYPSDREDDPPWENQHDASASRSGVGIPPGGDAGQHLAKVTSSDFDVTWVDPETGGGGGGTVHDIPAGGTTGQVLAKTTGTDYDVAWADGEAGPAGPPGGDDKAFWEAQGFDFGDTADGDVKAIIEAGCALKKSQGYNSVSLPRRRLGFRVSSMPVLPDFFVLWGTLVEMPKDSPIRVEGTTASPVFYSEEIPWWKLDGDPLTEGGIAGGSGTVIQGFGFLDPRFPYSITDWRTEPNRADDVQTAIVYGHTGNPSPMGMRVKSCVFIGCKRWAGQYFTTSSGNYNVSNVRSSNPGSSRGEIVVDVSGAGPEWDIRKGKVLFSGLVFDASAGGVALSSLMNGQKLRISDKIGPRSFQLKIDWDNAWNGTYVSGGTASYDLIEGNVANFKFYDCCGNLGFGGPQFLQSGGRSELGAMLSVDTAAKQIVDFFNSDKTQFNAYIQHQAEALATLHSIDGVDWRAFALHSALCLLFIDDDDFASSGGSSDDDADASGGGIGLGDGMCESIHSGIIIGRQGFQRPLNIHNVKFFCNVLVTKDGNYPVRADQGVIQITSCAFMTTANVNLAGGGLAAGTMHDGVTAVAGMRALVPAQTTPAENGVYIVPASGAASRANTGGDTAAMDTWARTLNRYVEVTGGNIYPNGGADTYWVTTHAEGGGVLGTDAIRFSKVKPQAIIVIKSGVKGIVINAFGAIFRARPGTRVPDLLSQHGPNGGGREYDFLLFFEDPASNSDVTLVLHGSQAEGNIKTNGLASNNCKIVGTYFDIDGVYRTIDTGPSSFLTDRANALPPAIITRAGTRMARSRLFMYDDLFEAIGEDILSRGQAFYILAAADQVIARMNLLSPDDYFLDKSGTVTFTADRGYTGDGTSGYFNTRIDPSASKNFLLNDASMGVWCGNDITQSGSFAIGTSTGNRSRINPRASGNFQARAQCTTDGTTAIARSVGAFMWSRDNSATFKMFVDGFLLASPSVASTALVSSNIYLLRDGSSNYSARQLQAAWIGRSLSNTQAQQLQAAVTSHLAALGAPI